MAVTIDDLPISHDLPQAGARPIDTAETLLDSMARHGLPEVYGFVNAGKLDADPALLNILRLWRGHGHLLGNHTYSHPHANEISATAFEADIARNEPLLAQLSSNANWRYFRYPYLETGNTLQKETEIRRYLAQNHYLVADVTVDFHDWEWSEPYARCHAKNDARAIALLKQRYIEAAVAALDAAAQQAQAEYGRPVKHTLLLHMNAFTAQMMDELLTAYEAQGVQFISLPEAVMDQLYAGYEQRAQHLEGYLHTSLLLRLHGWREPASTAAPYDTAKASALLRQICW